MTTLIQGQKDKAKVQVEASPPPIYSIDNHTPLLYNIHLYLLLF